MVFEHLNKYLLLVVLCKPSRWSSTRGF